MIAGFFLTTITGAATTPTIGDMLTSLLFEKTVTMESIDSHETLLLLRMEITGEYHVE